MAHHNSDLPQPADSHRRLLAADPFPPLAPPTLDAATAGSTGEFDLPVPWPAGHNLGGQPVAAGHGLHAAHGRTAPDPFASAPLPFAAAPLPGAGSPYGAYPAGSPNGAANGYAAPADLERLRAENEEMHKLIEEMKHIFEQASAQEEENGRETAKLRERVTELERLGQEKDEQVQMLTLQIHELEQHIQEAPAPLPTEDELSKMADEVEKERCKITQDRRTLDQERQQLREDEEALEKQMREMEVQMAKERAEM